MSKIVQKKQINSIIEICSFSVSVVNIVLNQKCDLIVSLFDENGKLAKQELLILQDEDYTLWGVSDDYIFDYVKSHYGLIEEIIEQVEQQQQPNDLDVQDV